MKTTKNPWSDYWTKGAEASFLDGKSRLQAYQMRKFWFERMSENNIKQPIIDVGTGNGVVVHWLTQFAKEKAQKFDVKGIDSAEVNPPDSSLKVVGKTPYENFKLPSNKKVGTFVSHFGIEYGDMSVGLKNLHAQLKRGGSLIALVHSKESVIYQKSRAIFELTPSVIKQLKKSVLPLQQALLKHGPKNLPASARQAQQQLNQFAKRNERNGAFNATNFIPVTKEIFDLAVQRQFVQSKELLENYLDSVQESRMRLTSVMKATESLGDTAQVQALFERAGFKDVSVQMVQFPETGIVGSCVQASK